MMKSVRGWLVGLLVVALFAVIPAALAQETLGLSEADYALWQTANATSSAQESFNYAFTMTVGLTGVEDAALDMNITGSGGIGETFSMLTDGAITAQGDSIPTQMEVRQVGDNLYINLGGQWFGGTLDEIMGMAGSLGGMTGLPVDPSALASGDVSGLTGNADMMGMLGGLSELSTGDFVSAQRLADSGEGFAVIEVAIGIADLLTSDALAPVLGGAIMGAAGGTSGAAMPTVDPAQAAMAAQMIGGLFEDAVFTITQTIDPATSLVQNTVINFQLPLSQLMMMAGQSAAGGAEAGLNLVFDISLSDYGAGTVVEAPAEFQPLSELMQGMGGMMGMSG